MNHENTRIHSTCLELIRLCAEAIARFPPGHGDLGNQLKRASASIALNFAEGCGHASLKERTRFLAMSRASASEVSMIFDVARAFQLVDDTQLAVAKDKCDHLGAMIYKFSHAAPRER